MRHVHGDGFPNLVLTGPMSHIISRPIDIDRRGDSEMLLRQEC